MPRPRMDIEDRRQRNRDAQRKHRNTMRSQIDSLTDMNERLLGITASIATWNPRKPSDASEADTEHAELSSPSLPRCGFSFGQADVLFTEGVERLPLPNTSSEPPVASPDPHREIFHGDMDLSDVCSADNLDFHHLLVSKRGCACSGNSESRCNRLSLGNDIATLSPQNIGQTPITTMDAAVDLAALTPLYPDDDTKQPDASALHDAVRLHRPTAVQTLLFCGMKADLTDEVGNMPLHYCAIYNNAEMVQLLLQNGASHCCKNHSGFTPLGLAVEFQHKNVVSTLIQSGLFR